MRYSQLKGFPNGYVQRLQQIEKKLDQISSDWKVRLCNFQVSEEELTDMPINLENKKKGEEIILPAADVEDIINRLNVDRGEVDEGILVYEEIYSSQV